MRYSWPGNVRELQHVMENVVVFSDDSDSEIQLKHLPSYLLEEEEKLPGDFVNINATAPLKRQLAEFERKAIIKALRENKYNLTKAADQIGYTRSNLQYRIKILDIN